MPRIVARALPALLVLVLLALALFAPPRVVRADRPLPTTDLLYYPVCTPVEQGGASPTLTYTVPQNEGFRQPLLTEGNIAACSLSTQPFNNANVTFDITYWDPATLAPPAGTIALQSRTYSTTIYTMNAARNDLIPPIITQALPNVAEPPPSHVAIEYHVSYPSTPTVKAPFQENDGSGALPASRILSDGTSAPLTGAHPVFNYSICGGDETLQQMRVAQSVMTTNVDLAPISYEWIQKFRLPVATQLGWVEFALDRSNPGATIDYGRVRIVDAAGQDVPPANFGTPLADAYFRIDTRYPFVPTWCTPQDGLVSTLEANHDYWLAITTGDDYLLMGRGLTGTESPWFQAAIGPLFRRFAAGAACDGVPDRVMAFRIIGTPQGTVSVGPPAPALTAFALRVSPNPARGATTLTWAGAQGAVALEVIDPRGRRVASAVSDAGRWSWNGAAADGAMLPAGVYFVRARDAAGAIASARVTLVR